MTQFAHLIMGHLQTTEHFNYILYAYCINLSRVPNFNLLNSYILNIYCSKYLQINTTNQRQDGYDKNNLDKYLLNTVLVIQY